MSQRSRWPEDLQLETLVTQAAELVGAATGHDLGGNAEDLRQVQLQHRPGAGVSALYRLPAIAGGGFIGLTTETLPETEGVVRIEIPADPELAGPDAGALTVSIWRHPQDPRLPGLRLATMADRVQRQWGDADRLTGLETVTYRPLRRAVIRAEFATPAPVVAKRRIYLKVMRAGRAADLHERHRMLSAAGLPVPPPLGDPVEDIVALAEVPGLPLSRLVLRDGAVGVDPASLVDLLERIPGKALSLPRRPAWTDRIDRYASAAAIAVPPHADRIRALQGRIRSAVESSDRGPVVPTHGDFYEANLLMREQDVSGLLDVDAVGPGHRVDDLGCFLGHLAVLPAVDRRYRRIPEALDHFGSAFEDICDPRALWARAAGVAVSLVAGARTPGSTSWGRDAEGRLAAAEALAERAR
ncbi:MAG: phosphotransferase [Arthrobacter sp.]|uniref:phosphotransferase n=1 Tax=Arthrobacter sp. TaxID=1667 RepID=UPI00348195AE